MNTGAHLQFGWLIAHARPLSRTERAVITLAAIAPDLDGLTILAGPTSAIFYDYHHILFHNLLSGLVYTAAVAAFFSRRLLVLLLCALSFAAHLLVDYVTAPWAMAPFWPLSKVYVNLGSRLPEWVLQYAFQFAGMILITACTAWLYLRYRRTPLEVISPRLDALIMNYVALPWREHCAECSARAHFRCARCAKPVCARHWRPRALSGTCAACAAQQRATAS